MAHHISPQNGTSMHDDTQYATATDRSTHDEHGDSWYAIATDRGAHDDFQYAIPTNLSMHGESRYAPLQPKKPTKNISRPTVRKMYNPLW